MWFSKIILLLPLVWLVKGEIACEEQDVEDVCTIPQQAYRLKFPESTYQMEKLCLDVLPFTECVVHYQEQCSSPSVMPLKMIQSLNEAAKVICERGSALFEGVVKYGNCYQNFKDTLPHNFAMNCSVEIEKDPSLAYLNDPNNHPELNRCYYNIEGASCLAKKISEDCGRAAKELILHFIREVGPWNFICSDYQQEAQRLMNDLNFTFEPQTTKEELRSLLQS